MGSQHSGDHEAARSTAAIAAMDDRRSCEGPPDAIGAWSLVPIERRGRAHKPVVVDGLHDGDALCSGRVVGGGGDQGERVVKMDDGRPMPSKEAPQIPVGLPAPYGPRGDIPRVHPRDPLIVVGVSNDLVPIGFHESALGHEDVVLASGMLISLMNEDELHLRGANPVG